jgi:hypothetical protein
MLALSQEVRVYLLFVSETLYTFNKTNRQTCHNIMYHIETTRFEIKPAYKELRDIKDKQ